MKKILCVLLAAACIFTLAACSDTAGSETGSPSTETTVPATDAPVKELVLVDNEHALVKVTAIDAANFWGYTLKVFIENKTDKELMFTVDSVSVNGFMCDPFWAASVAPGMKANESISFSESDFEENGIKAVEEIKFTLRAYDNEDMMSEDLIKESITIQP